MGILRNGMGWDRTEKYVPWTSLFIAHTQSLQVFNCAGQIRCIRENPNRLIR